MDTSPLIIPFATNGLCGGMFRGTFADVMMENWYMRREDRTGSDTIIAAGQGTA
jgi:hypothetical protein